MDIVSRINVAIRGITNWEQELTDCDITSWRGEEYAYGTIGTCDGVGGDLCLYFAQLFCPNGAVGTICFSATAYALEFGLCSGQFPFVLKDSSLISLVPNARDFLAYENFSSTTAIARYSASFPECAGYSWEKIREWGYPYYASSNSQGVAWRDNEGEIIRSWAWPDIIATLL